MSEAKYDARQAQGDVGEDEPVGRVVRSSAGIEDANVEVLIQRLRAADAGGLREQTYQSLCGDAADALSRLNGAAQPSPEYTMLPKKLTAENGAKYALIGEFFETYHYVDYEGIDAGAEGNIKEGKVVVSWDTIKRIWDRAVEHFEALDKQNAESMVPVSEVTDDDREPKA